MRGKISQWKDDKGFGFILPEDRTDKVFFHITSVKTRARRPQIGDTVLYELMRDAQNRLKAKSVVIEGVVTQPSSQKKSKGILVEPPKKSVLDYCLIVLLIGALAATSFIFFKTGNVEKSLPYGIPAIVALVLLNRQKKPKEKKFRCARCKKMSEHDARTIKAWNNGFLKLYCSSCHRQWLNENPMPVSNRGGGCLGTLVILAAIPIIGGVIIYQWIA